MAIVLLVALRLVIGWHFYKEGAKKKLDPDFSSAGFLLQAKGPLADWYHAYVPDFHGWNDLLAQPLENRPLTAEQEGAIEKWDLARDKALDQWNRDRKDGKEDTPNEAPLADFPPYAPYGDWARRIEEDWRSSLATLIARGDLNEKQQNAAADMLQSKLRQLRVYLEEQAEDIAKFRHELWRLAQQKSEPTAEGLPYQEERIARKEAEIRSLVGPWRPDIGAMEDQLVVEWSGVLDKGQMDSVASVFEPEGAVALRRIDSIVTYLTLGVGVCLMLGLLTRVAAVVGAGFLFSVILSQPPWVAGAEPVYYQAVEMFSLLVLAAVGAGRWAGLDFFLGSVCCKCCRSKGAK